MAGISKDEKALRMLFRLRYNMTFPKINIPAFWARAIGVLGVPGEIKLLINIIIPNNSSHGDHIYTDTYCLSYLVSAWQWENINPLDSHLSLLVLIILSIKLRYGSIQDNGLEFIYLQNYPISNHV